MKVLLINDSQSDPKKSFVNINFNGGNNLEDPYFRGFLKVFHNMMLRGSKKYQ